MREIQRDQHFKSPFQGVGGKDEINYISELSA